MNYLWDIHRRADVEEIVIRMLGLMIDLHYHYELSLDLVIDRQSGKNICFFHFQCMGENCIDGHTLELIVLANGLVREGFVPTKLRHSNEHVDHSVHVS